MANNQNTMRDMKRSILKAVRDSQKTKQDAMDEYVAARVNIKSLEERLEEAREKATLLRRKAKDAGNTSAELKTADDLIDARWTGRKTGRRKTGSPENAAGTVNPEREHPAMEENTQGGMPGEPNRWEGGESLNRPEPRPLPKPLRVLCLFVAALLVCSLGVIVANHQPSTAGDDHGSATDAKQESTGKRKTVGPATVRRPGGGGNPGSRRLVSAHHRVPR